MPQWTIMVEFETHDGQEAAFDAIIREHARRTLAEEPGCLGFDVLRPVTRDGASIANNFLLVETYRDEAAITAHEKNPRMPSVGLATAPLLKSRRLIWATGAEEQEETGLLPDQLNASNDD